MTLGARTVNLYQLVNGVYFYRITNVYPQGKQQLSQNWEIACFLSDFAFLA